MPLRAATALGQKDGRLDVGGLHAQAFRA